MRNAVASFTLLTALVIASPSMAQSTAATVLDETVAPGANYDTAEFRLWLPPRVPAVRAIAVLGPGSNGDGRGQVDDPVWQGVARRPQPPPRRVRATHKPPRQGIN